MKTAYAYKVDKNIPLSARPAGPGRPRIYPWEHMSVGDSFLYRTALLGILRYPRQSKRVACVSLFGRETMASVFGESNKLVFDVVSLLDTIKNIIYNTKILRN